MGKQKKVAPLSDRDQGGAFIAWYKQTMQMDGFQGGMITRAQAARILGISNLGVGRLAGRGHIRARYFPREPSIEWVPVGAEDSFWVHLVDFVTLQGGDASKTDWYEACYVSLDDVVKLWEKNEQREKSAIDWGRFWSEKPEFGPYYKGAEPAQEK